MENKELKERFIDERTEIEYRLVGDYYIPNITTKSKKNRKYRKVSKIKIKLYEEI